MESIRHVEPNRAIALAVLIASSCGARSSTDPPATRAPAVAVASAEDGPQLRKVRVEFLGPMGEERRLTSARIELRPLAGGEPTLEDFQARDERFWQVSEHIGPVAPGRYALTVESPGSRTYRGVVDVPPSKDESTRVSDSGERVEAFLWPEDRIPVRVLTTDGGDIAELGAALGVAPDLLFIGSFRVVALAGAEGAFDWSTPVEEGGAVTRPVHDWEWRTHEGPIAAIDAKKLPLRIGLELHGVPLGVESVGTDAREVVFRLDAPALAARLGALRFTLLRKGSPATDARVSLLPRNEYHRRPEFLEVVPSAEGRIAFEHLCPGIYDLRIERGRSARTEPLTVVAGEKLSLADIDLDASPQLRYRVVDELGKGVQAIVDLVPFDPALDAHAQLSAAIPLWSDRDGRGSVNAPRKKQKVIARAWAANPHGANELDPHSGFVLFAPQDPSVTELVLVLHPSVEVTFDTVRDGAREVEIRDEQGLVVAREPIDGKGTTRLHLVRGRYVARLLDARAAALVERAFEVLVHPSTIEMR